MSLSNRFQFFRRQLWYHLFSERLGKGVTYGAAYLPCEVSISVRVVPLPSPADRYRNHLYTCTHSRSTLNVSLLFDALTDLHIRQSIFSLRIPIFVHRARYVETRRDRSGQRKPIHTTNRRIRFECWAESEDFAVIGGSRLKHAFARCVTNTPVDAKPMRLDTD